MLGTSVTLGARGWRLLDDVPFACEVVALDVHADTVDVRYCDDDRVERQLDRREFASETDERQQHQQHQQHQQPPSDNFERLANCGRAATLDELATFLDHVEWLRSLARVSWRWRRRLMRRLNWRSLRIPRAEDAIASTDFASVCKLLESVVGFDDARDENKGESDDGCLLVGSARIGDVVEELVLSGSAVTDEQAVQLIQRCGNSLKSVALRGCNRISFLLLYELTRLGKQSQPERSVVRQVDVWLCRGISPTYVTQLYDHGALERAGLRVRGPGFVIMEVSAQTWKWIESEAGSVTISRFRDTTAPATATCTGDDEGESRDPIRGGTLTVRFVPRASFLLLFNQHHDTHGTISNDTATVARELRGVRDQMDKLQLAMIPLVRLDHVLNCTKTSSAHYGQYSLIGMPVSPDDLLQLVREHEEGRVELQLRSLLHQLTPPTPKAHPKQSEHEADTKEEPELSLDARADMVFAMLRQTTTDLETQVAHLERQVQKMTVAKNRAQQEYLEAQLELDRVAKEADRALLSLATSSTMHPPPPPPCMSICSAPVIAQKTGDELLPALPSDEQLQALGTTLERNAFAVLDNFFGQELSTSVHADIELMYSESRCTTPNSTAITSSDQEVSVNGSDGTAPVPAAEAFQLGELAGGNTGRNLRYMMQHVRGDYMLWLDEHDAFCPLSVRQVLRQLDRLVLERLPAYNLELRASSLLRKKAMATCYPGNGARYTKHCDNPNKNGRKLTAILYLNANWIPSHGGELQLHVPHRRHNSGSLTQRQSKIDNDDTGVVKKVAPLMDRLLLFFSDRRVPHEVLPCLGGNRFALTVWYLDFDEFMNAQVFGSILQDQRDEERRIQREIEGFSATREVSPASAAAAAAATTTDL